jgi:hypothetical protein
MNKDNIDANQQTSFLLVSFLAKSKFFSAGKCPTMQPTIAVNGHSAALEVFYIRRP